MSSIQALIGADLQVTSYKLCGRLPVFEPGITVTITTIWSSPM